MLCKHCGESLYKRNDYAPWEHLDFDGSYTIWCKISIAEPVEV